MVVNMEVEETKEYIKKLMDDKDKIEAELRASKEILDSNHIGMDESLVDSEGYPRQDIDVYQVRHARHKIICLKNDHKSVMKKIEEGLHKLFALSGHRANSSDPVAVNGVNDHDKENLEPFLRVNSVFPGSPAEIAGIEVDDLILEFGSIDYQKFKSLKDIDDLVQNSRYKEISIKIKRASNILALKLISCLWVENGLLGYNVI
ncbi:LOW QUALITY PROTEIN: 26S proteasome non-ATPase regulatory subunit 9 [Augochlora pura]